LFLGGLGRDIGSPAQRAPAAFGELPADAAHAIVELTPMSGPSEQALAKLESRWFAPLRAALARGALERVELVANDRCWRIDRGGGWKFWRRPRHWLAALQA
jgi:hypothetical protein